MPLADTLAVQDVLGQAAEQLRTDLLEYGRLSHVPIKPTEIALDALAAEGESGLMDPIGVGNDGNTSLGNQSGIWISNQVTNTSAATVARPSVCSLLGRMRPTVGSPHVANGPSRLPGS